MCGRTWSTNVACLTLPCRLHSTHSGCWAMYLLLASRQRRSYPRWQADFRCRGFSLRGIGLARLGMDRLLPCCQCLADHTWLHGHQIAAVLASVGLGDAWQSLGFKHSTDAVPTVATPNCDCDSPDRCFSFFCHADDSPSLFAQQRSMPSTLELIPCSDQPAKDRRR